MQLPRPEQISYASAPKDDEYATYAIPAYQYLAGRAEFVVAGAPACTPGVAGSRDQRFCECKVQRAGSPARLQPSAWYERLTAELYETEFQKK